MGINSDCERMENEMGGVQDQQEVDEGIWDCLYQELRDEMERDAFRRLERVLCGDEGGRAKEYRKDIVVGGLMSVLNVTTN